MNTKNTKQKITKPKSIKVALLTLPLFLSMSFQQLLPMERQSQQLVDLALKQQAALLDQELKKRKQEYTTPMSPQALQSAKNQFVTLMDSIINNHQLNSDTKLENIGDKMHE